MADKGDSVKSEQVSAIGPTGAGKRAGMAAMLKQYAEDHPLGRAHRRGPMLILEPGPDVIPGEVIRGELEGPTDNGSSVNLEAPE
jgi:hypothetical protein